jgi:hypothetical protein
MQPQIVADQPVRRVPEQAEAAPIEKQMQGIQGALAQRLIGYGKTHPDYVPRFSTKYGSRWTACRSGCSHRWPNLPTAVPVAPAKK